MPTGLGLQGVTLTPAVPQPSLLDRARAQYPYLRDANLSFTLTPDPDESRRLEYWAPDEPGGKRKRPPDLPIGTHGIQVFSENVRPLDILGDYVSHAAVKEDPTLQALYNQFSNMVDPSVMQSRYKYHKGELGETRPYEEWLSMTGMPELFRGYTFDQFPDAESLYTPEQLAVLDRVRDYLGIVEEK